MGLAVDLIVKITQLWPRIRQRKPPSHVTATVFPGYNVSCNMNVTTKPHLHQDWIDSHAFGIVKALQKSGFTTYLVGGCVRDLLLGITPKDFDIATSALPEEVHDIIYRSYMIGKRFRLVLVKRDGQQFEVATFRRESPEEAETDSEDSAVFGDNFFGTPEEDARRRDFTVNGMFYDPVRGQLIDHADGLPDLEMRVVRMIGDPNKRLLEDPIRIMRGLRLKHMIHFSLAADLREAMMKHAASLAPAVLPRKREEILKWLKLRDPSLVFLESFDLQILQAISPTLHRAIDGGAGNEEFLTLLRNVHEHPLDKTSPLELFASLVHAFARSYLPPQELDVSSPKQLLEHPVLVPWMKDELGMFKHEQACVLKAIHMQTLLRKRREFERRGDRRQQAVLRNEAFPLALKWAERDMALPSEDLLFWKERLARMGDLPTASSRRRRPRRRRPPRRKADIASAAKGDA